MGLFGFGKKKEVVVTPETFEKIVALITDDASVQETASRYFMDTAAYYAENAEDLKEYKVEETDTCELSWRALMSVLLEKGIAVQVENLEYLEGFREYMGALAAKKNLPFDEEWFGDDIIQNSLKDPVMREPDLFYDVFPDVDTESLVEWLEKLEEEWGDTDYAIGSMKYETKCLTRPSMIIMFIMKSDKIQKLKQLAKSTNHKAGDAYACW